MDDDFKLCSDGEFMPVNRPCPPPYSGPYYYYPYENIPLPPEEGNSDFVASSDRGGAPLSSGAVAGIIIIVGFIFFMMCLIALKCRARFIFGNLVRVTSRNARNNELAGELLVNSSGDNMLVNIAGSGLEEKLVNLLPVCEFVGLVQEGKIDGKERQECAVCLSLFEDKEIVRVLPKCHHIFHIQCIDKWFESHANCPLCRERITLQTIQLSFIHSEKLIDDQHPLLDPAHQNLGHDLPSHHPLIDQHAISSPSRDVCVHSDHARLASCDPHPHQNMFLSIASAANNTNDPHTTESADIQPPTRAAASHLVDNDQKSAEVTLRVHNIPSVPAVTAESMTYRCDTESKQDEKACNEAARDACVVYISDTASLYVHSNPSAADDRSHGASAHQSHGEADDRTSPWQRASKKTGDFFYAIRAQQTHAGHDIIDGHKTFFTTLKAKQSMSHDFDRAIHNSHQVVQVPIEPSPRASCTRKFSLLRKSFSTGSMFESNYGKPSHPVHGEIL